MSARSRNSNSKLRSQWEWNIPLLLKSVGAVVICSLLGAALYFWQSSSMAAELLTQANNCEERGESREKVKWLSRYVRLVPNDVEQLASLAFAVDAQEKGPTQNVEFARSRLAAALVACGNSEEHKETCKNLRRKLIPRLLQLGSEKAPEVEKHIPLLDASENDTEVLKWLADSLFLQRMDLEYQTRDINQYERTKDYWKWLASQPTGSVLQKAVDANPRNAELAQKLLYVCNQQPSWFSGGNESRSKQELAELSNRVLEKLAAQKDNGHSQFLVYSYAATSDREKAGAVLAQAFDPALARLTEFAKRPSGNENKNSPPGSQPAKGIIPFDYVPVWDWQIVLERSKFVDALEAEQICEKLTNLANDKIANQLLEQAYQRLAVLKMERGANAEAIEVCKSGLASIKQSSSLNRVIALANLKLENVQEAEKALKEIEDATELRLRQLDGALGLGMSSSEKVTVRQQLAAEKWTANVLKGQISLVKKEYVRSAELLRDSFKTSIAIKPEDRLEAGLLLASCYSETEQWDLVGQTYDECSLLRPKDKSISLAAIRAWRRAGSTQRASEQIGGLDNVNFAEAIERAQVLASVPKVDLAAVRSAIRSAREQLEKLSADQRSLVEPWRLELLELRFESVDKKPEKELQQDSLSSLEAIAEKYADVGEVQSRAALDFAAFARLEASDAAIGRLEQIAERSKNVNDRVSVVLTKASILEVKKDTAGALLVLEDAMKSMPEQALRFAKVAAQIETRENRIEKAYELLCSVPDDKLDFEAMVTLTGIAEYLRSASGESKASALDDKLGTWIDRLKLTEGKDGTNWRYLEAERKLSEITDDSNAKKMVEQASTYYKEIDVLRPSWGLASALGARIASVKGNLEEAIGLWRRAIRDGDRRISTVLSLMRDLIDAKRVAEAEAEMQQVSGLTDSVVPLSAWAVSFAMKKRDFSEALALAEQLTLKKPEDVDGWLLRAQTSFAAIADAGKDETRITELRDLAWICLERAHTLSAGKNTNVWEARFRFKLLTGDKTGAASLLQEMLQESALSEEVRFTEAGRHYVTLKEYGLARKCFDSVLLLNPRAVQVHLALADLNNAIGDTEASLNSLRKAQQAAPMNQQIRERLAVNLAFSKNAIDLKEVDSLLTNVASTPRTAIVKALIDLNRGDKDRKFSAVKSLKELSQLATPDGIDAKRLLANHYAIQWMRDKFDQAEAAVANFELARQLYEELLTEANPNPIDAAKYINLLISFDANAKESKLATTEDYLGIAGRVLTKLESTSGSSVASLQLRVRLAKARGEQESIGDVAENWVEQAGDLESLGMQNLWEITGQTLMQLGHPEESISWLQKVYEKDPKKYGLLAIALARQKKFDQALDICIKAYRSEPSAAAASLILEVVILQPNIAIPDDVAQVLKEAPARFTDSSELLESMGTLHLMQNRLLEAVSFYEMAEKLDPKRRRTLNNLAMALSEMPMKQPEALAKIEKAIEIYGRDPDLLDTLGQVLSRNGRVQDALNTLKEACRRKDDDSFKIHLAQVLVNMKDMSAAKEQWAKIDQSKLDDSVLTPEDQKTIKSLNSQFSEKS